MLITLPELTLNVCYPSFTDDGFQLIRELVLFGAAVSHVRCEQCHIITFDRGILLDSDGRKLEFTEDRQRDMARMSGIEVTCTMDLVWHLAESDRSSIESQVYGFLIEG